MNNRWFAFVLILFLLSGCADKEDETAPSEALYETKPTDTVGFSFFEDVSDTGGAVRAMALDTRDAAGFRFLGENILISSGYPQTTLTLLDGDTFAIVKEVTLPLPVFPDNPAVAVHPDGLTYVDEISREVVFLNSGLEEIAKITLPEDCRSTSLSPDAQLLYYCTEDALRVLNLTSGIDSPVREMRFPHQEVTGIHCDGRVLQCRTTYDDGSTHTLFVSSENGSLLHETEEDITLNSHGDLYFCTCMDGAYRELLSGSADFGPSLLVTETDPVSIIPVLSRQMVLLQTQQPDGHTVLDCYHLVTGSHTAQVTLPEHYEIVDIQPDSREYLLWFLCHDWNNSQDLLCQWNLSQSYLVDGHNYLQPRWSLENPDLDGLAQCEELAMELSEKHGIQILIWENAVQATPVLQIAPEYQVPLIQDMLLELDNVLSQYPDEFLAELSDGIGGLHICPVRDIPQSNDSQTELPCLLHWDNQEGVYLMVTPGPTLPQQVHCLLSDLIDCRVLGISDAYDGWKQGGGHQERIRILETAMLDGQAEFFSSGYMQSQLRQLCLSIRETFRTAKSADTLPWEQYLPRTP